VTHVDLDRALQQQYPRRTLIDVTQDWDVVSAVLDELEASRPSALPTLVTIGAGTQDLDRTRQDRLLERWLMLRQNRVLLITDDPDVLFDRNMAHRDSRERFDELEFGSPRLRIYSIAAETLDFTGLGKEEAARCLGRCVAAFRTAPGDQAPDPYVPE
jgi:hypothetical protein